MPELAVKHAMLVDPPSIAPQETVRAAAERMCALDAGFLVVHAPGADPIGLLTDRDMTLVTATGRDPARTMVCEVVSPHVVVCRDLDDLEDAAWLMERNDVRRLVVVDEHRHVCGVLSVEDVARVFATRLAGDVLRHTSHRAPR